jgi:hypothetical protein
MPSGQCVPRALAASMPGEMLLFHQAAEMVLQRVEAGAGAERAAWVGGYCSTPRNRLIGRLDCARPGRVLSAEWCFGTTKKRVGCRGRSGRHRQ